MQQASSPWLLVFGQVFMVLFAVVLAFYPQYYLPLLVAYFAVVILMNVRGQRIGGAPRRILEARRLYVEEKASEIALDDSELIREYAAQTRTMLRSFLVLFLSLALFWLIFSYRGAIVGALESQAGLPPKIALFVFWLALLEFFFVFNRVVTRIVQGKQQVMLIVPSKFVVTEKGIASLGLGGVAIEFPLPEDYTITMNQQRRFVEISDGKTRRIRLYTKNPQRLYELILKLNRKAAR